MRRPTKSKAGAIEHHDADAGAIGKIFEGHANGVLVSSEWAGVRGE